MVLPGSTMEFPGSLPKLFVPGFSQNNPASESQFSFRSSPSSVFHFSKAARYSASGAAFGKRSGEPAREYTETASNRTAATIPRKRVMVSHYPLLQARIESESAVLNHSR